MKVYSFPEFVYYYIYLHSDQHKRRIINEKSWDFLYTLNHYDNDDYRYIIVFCSFFRVLYIYNILFLIIGRVSK